MNKSNRWLWLSTGVLSLMAILVLFAGFIVALNDLEGARAQTSLTPNEQKPGKTTTEKEHTQIVVLGDSLAKGVGDEQGLGYVGRMKQALERAGELPVYVWSFAQSGITTHQLLQMLTDDKSEVPKAIEQADLILLSIGGNDITGVARNHLQLPNNQEANSLTWMDLNEVKLDFQSVAKELPAALERMKNVVDVIYELNKDALIMYTGLYHPFAALDKEREGNVLISNWNASVTEKGHEIGSMIVVPTYDLFTLNGANKLADDWFHPNALGYEEIATRMVQVLSQSNWLQDE